MGSQVFPSSFKQYDVEFASVNEGFTRIRSLSEISNKETLTLTDTHLEDVGHRQHQYYASKLTWVAAKTRSLLLPLLKLELPLLTWIQKFHTPLLNFYFLHTANLGSHTFYVIMLPIPAWFGYQDFLRDFIFTFGMGIVLTGWIKDSLCLPRPISPPLKRLTLSHYTAREYGCPSSHTANATGVCFLLSAHLYMGTLNFGDNGNKYLILGMIWYWLSLVIGRMYCGMHGLVDIGAGAIIGISVVLIRLAAANFWDHIVIFSNGVLAVLAPFIIIAFHYTLIILHPVPVEECPCFEDSVAFIGVLLGLDLGHYLLAHSPWKNSDSLMPAVVPYDYSQLGILKTIARVILGVASVAIWKTASKKILLKIKPIEIHEECYAYKNRWSWEIAVKTIVYAGISICVVGAKILFQVFGLGVDA